MPLHVHQYSSFKKKKTQYIDGKMCMLEFFFYVAIKVKNPGCASVLMFQAEVTVVVKWSEYKISLMVLSASVGRGWFHSLIGKVTQIIVKVKDSKLQICEHC